MVKFSEKTQCQKIFSKKSLSFYLEDDNKIDSTAGIPSSTNNKLCYNIASRATQSNSVYVSVPKIPIVHAQADGVSKSLRQNFFFFCASGHC